MRPDLLVPLFANLDGLPGLGPRLTPLYARLVGGEHVADALWRLPTGLIDRRYSPKVMEAEDGRIATLTVKVEAHLPPPSGSRAPYRIRCSDDTGCIHLVYFHPRKDWLLGIYSEGETMVVSGKVEMFNGERQMPHPDYAASPSQGEAPPSVEPVYPLCAGISLKTAVKVAKTARARAPETPEWLDPSLVQRRGWAPWRTALEQAHTPVEDADVSPLSPARMRLAYDELLANQLALALMRLAARTLKGRALQGDGRLRQKALAALPFDLTGAQVRSLREIGADMAAPERMLRLLQGDVGAGKTVVALMAMLNAVETGAQAVLMAPTELLARQHLESLQPPAKAAGVRIAALTGRDKGAGRRKLLADVAGGAIDILIGTHAVFSCDVVYKDLALAVIDEQHRFGVQQRLKLATKGTAADILVMTATPIPRTLALTAYGDMDCSRLDEKPPGRRPVATRILSNRRTEDVVAGLRRAQTKGAKAYWVCPLVEESETSDMAAAQDRFAHLKTVFGDRVGLVHGGMKPVEKDAAMEAFAGNGLDILVATTVIEVGMDVPAATIMVIEHAERFGLAQLHQLRGRVGRGAVASSCLLLYGPALSPVARARLEIMRQTEDGFLIAEEDLRLRGVGEVLGVRQSGLPEFRLADIAVHGELLAMARDDARLIVARDPELKTERGQALRVLLYLFERDGAVKTLRCG